MSGCLMKKNNSKNLARLTLYEDPERLLKTREESDKGVTSSVQQVLLCMFW
jgi:hypothetical protein